MDQQRDSAFPGRRDSELIKMAGPSNSLPYFNLANLSMDNLDSTTAPKKERTPSIILDVQHFN